MAFSDVMLGFQTWSDYVSTADQTAALRRQTAALTSAERGTQTTIGASTEFLGEHIERSMVGVEGGIAKLNADFNVLMGEAVWMLQLQNAQLQSILKVLQAPLNTSARELRRRAERAYRNGWYDEALTDFLESANRNYQDFAVHRSIGNIYLFHRNDPRQAAEYFRKSAKYARAASSLHAAEAHYFAGIASTVLKQLHDARQEFAASTDLNPVFFEAYYRRAGVEAAIQDSASAIRSLRSAIQGDPRYYQSAQDDRAFDNIRTQVAEFLSGLRLEALRAVRDALEKVQGSLNSLTNDHSAVEDLVGHVRQKRERAAAKSANASYIELLQLHTAAEILSKIMAAISALHDMYLRLRGTEEAFATAQRSHTTLLEGEGRLREERAPRQLGCPFVLALYGIPGLIGGWLAHQQPGWEMALFFLPPLWPFYVALVAASSNSGSEAAMFAAFQKGVTIGIVISIALWFFLYKLPTTNLEAAKKENAAKRRRIASSEADLGRARAAAAAAEHAVGQQRDAITNQLATVWV